MYVFISDHIVYAACAFPGILFFVLFCFVFVFFFFLGGGGRWGWGRMNRLDVESVGDTLFMFTLQHCRLELIQRYERLLEVRLLLLAFF